MRFPLNDFNGQKNSCEQVVLYQFFKWLLKYAYKKLPQAFLDFYFIKL